MRSDDAKETRRDISADELLRQLNESIAKSPSDKSSKAKTGGAAKNGVGSAVVTKKKPVKMLSIDDDVYEGAQRGIAPAPQPARSDKKLSDDAEIDALLKKYLNTEISEKVEPEPVSEAEAQVDTEPVIEPTVRTEAVSEAEPIGDPYIEAIVKQEKPAKDAQITVEDESEINADDVEAPIESVESQVQTEASDAEVYAPEMDETQVEESVIAEEEISDEDSSLLEAAALLTEIDENGDPVADDSELIKSLESFEADAASTAVFDVQKVHADIHKKYTGSDEDQATGVFKPVSAKTNTSNEDTAELPIKVSADGTEVGSTESVVKVTDVSGEEIDQTDLHLMIAFGMNDELKDKVGEENATRLEDELVDELVKEQKREEDHAKQISHYEYVSREQNAEIIEKYQNSYYGAIIRLACAAVLFGMMFFIENFSLFGINLPIFMRPEAYPVVYTMIDLQFIVFGCALIFRHLFTGAKNLVLLRPTPESLTAFSMLLSIFYTVVSCVSAPRLGYKLFNLPIMVLVIFALVYDFLKIKRDVFGFSVISAKKKKIIVRPVSDEDSSTERAVFSEYLGDNAKIVRVGKTDFVDGFFARVNKDGGEISSKPILGIMIPTVLVIVIAFFAIGYIKERSLYEAIKLAFLSATMTLPLSAYIIYSLPIYRAARQAYDSDSAIIGEASIEEYAGSAVISFEDKEVFPPKGAKVTSIKVFGNNRIDQIIYNLASAFMKIGGPLAEVFGQATVDTGHSDKVEVKEVDDDGFTVVIDDIQVSIGKASYIEKLDLDPGYDAEDRQAEEEAGIGIFYIAYHGELAAKVYAQYTIDAEFEKILAQLYKTGMCVGIKSFDPNINDLMLARKLGKVNYPVKVIRSRSMEDIPHTVDHCESGIVSKRSVKSLLRAVASCERVSSAVKTAQLVKILGMAIGFAVTLFLTFVKTDFAVSSLWTSLYQLILIAVSGAISRLLV